MKHLSEHDCLEVAKRINCFRGAIFWSDIVELAEEVTNERYTRQTLEKKEAIRAAYELAQRKASSCDGKRQSKKLKSKELHAAEERIVRLKGEVKLLEVLNSRLREQFVVWAENARRKGLTEADLNEKLTKLVR